MHKVLVIGLALLAGPVVGQEVGNAAAMDIPLSDLSGWTSLSYRKIPLNAVSVSGEALHIAVNKSAGPLIYKLDAPAAVTGITVRARWTGELTIPPGVVQGEKGADDFVLRMGLVESGDQTLNWLQRKIAADWVLQLFRLAPKGSGVKRIDFVSTTRQPNLVGTSRTHPLSDLLHETRVTYLEKPGSFELSYTFEQPVQTLALWIASDGDDTGSQFDVFIDQIRLTTQL